MSGVTSVNFSLLQKLPETTSKKRKTPPSEDQLPLTQKQKYEESPPSSSLPVFLFQATSATLPPPPMNNALLFSWLGKMNELLDFVAQDLTNKNLDNSSVKLMTQCLIHSPDNPFSKTTFSEEELSLLDLALGEQASDLSLSDDTRAAALLERSRVVKNLQKTYAPNNLKYSSEIIFYLQNAIAICKEESLKNKLLVAYARESLDGIKQISFTISNPQLEGPLLNFCKMISTPSLSLRLSMDWFSANISLIFISKNYFSRFQAQKNQQDFRISLLAFQNVCKNLVGIFSIEIPQIIDEIGRNLIDEVGRNLNAPDETTSAILSGELLYTIGHYSLLKAHFAYQLQLGDARQRQDDYTKAVNYITQATLSFSEERNKEIADEIRAAELSLSIYELDPKNQVDLSL